jgi:hypothetical protein
MTASMSAWPRRGAGPAANGVCRAVRVLSAWAPDRADRFHPLPLASAFNSWIIVIIHEIITGRLTLGMTRRRTRPRPNTTSQPVLAKAGVQPQDVDVVVNTPGVISSDGGSPIPRRVSSSSRGASKLAWRGSRKCVGQTSRVLVGRHFANRRTPPWLRSSSTPTAGDYVWLAIMGALWDERKVGHIV